MNVGRDTADELRVGRHIVHTQIAAGGMATVHVGRLLGGAGFARTVAIKRLHPQLANDAQFVTAFVDEARLASCVRHPNVVPTLDVVVRDDEILVVMEYVHGESLGRLLKGSGGAGGRATAPLPVVAAIVSEMLSGLHAAHEANGPNGEPLRLVHRDVSPQNVIIGTDGVTRVLDFGVAKATWRTQDTRDGVLKGKMAYMSPEQLNWRPLDRRADIFAAAIVLWEALTGQRLFSGESSEEIVDKILHGEVQAPSSLATLPAAVDAVVFRGLARNPDERYQTALEMALALEAAAPLATGREVGAWVAERAEASLAKRAAIVRELEQSTFAHEANVPGVADAVRARALARATADDVATSSLIVGIGAPPREAEATESAVSRPAVTPRTAAAWRRPALVAGLALTLASLVGMGALFRRSAPMPPAITPGEPTAGTTPPGASAPPVAPSPPDSASAAQVSSAAVSASGPRPGPATPPKRSRTRAPNCDPPYAVGPDGIRRFRPECI